MNLSSYYPEIETERLLLRQFKASDIDSWANQIFADPEVIRFLPRREMTAHERAERGFRAITEKWQKFGFGEWAVTDKENGDFIGHCGLNLLEETGEVEVDYALAKSCWGRGLATEAAYASLRFGFETAGLKRIIGFVFPENTASQRVLEHIGLSFENEGQYFGLWLLIYAIQREDFQIKGSLYQIQNP